MAAGDFLYHLDRQKMSRQRTGGVKIKKRGVQNPSAQDGEKAINRIFGKRKLYI
jgi:hypothetical protein